ncbi:MAG: prepilin peptidase [Planctomycetota bacterium]
MPFELTPELLLVYLGVFGLFVGSFLNVCIHRLPKEGQSVWSPRRSHCPKCNHAIRWYENLPVVSWLFLRARCGGCKARISVRYPLVELLTGALWVVVGMATPEGAYGLLFFRILIVSALLVATFVDFDCFEIPDEVSIGGMWLAPVASFLVPSLHEGSKVALYFAEGGEVDRLAALTTSLFGLAVGGGILIAIGKLGKLVFGRDAMGFGDVKLLSAGGGFVGPGGALVALMIGSLLASVAGVVNVLRFYLIVRGRDKDRKRTGRGPGRALAVARIAGRYLPFGPYLALGIGIVLLYWNEVRDLVLSSYGLQ